MYRVQVPVVGYVEAKVYAESQEKAIDQVWDLDLCWVLEGSDRDKVSIEEIELRKGPLHSHDGNLPLHEVRVRQVEENDE